MSSFQHLIYFTGKDDPRDGCIMIGQDVKPVFFEFETIMMSPSSARTTISSDQHPVAAFHWASDTGSDTLGVAAIGDREFPIEHLVLPGSAPNARRFHAADGRFYEWRRSSYRNSKSYELYVGPNAPPIAMYRQLPQATPIGPSYGILEYNFANELFLLQVILTLNLNRWLDSDVD